MFYFMGLFIVNVIIFLISVIPDVAGTTNNLSEEKVSDKCFELIFAFDEVKIHS